MKQLIFPLTLALVLSLSACTSQDEPEATLPPDPAPEADTMPLPEEDILGDGVTPDTDNALKDDLDGMMDDVDDLMDGDGELGVPYDEMVDNGMVHDTDGNLNDGENSRSDLVQ